MPIPTMASPAMLAVQQKVETLKKQGMPAAQIGQILQNEVLPTGAVPVAQLWQLMNYVKANSQATQAPPSDSVAVQLADQVKQMAMAKSHPLGSVPQMGQAQQPFPPSGPSSSPPAGPSPGVAGLPAPNVGQPGAYAGGGIVSFDDGGEVPSDVSWMGDVGHRAWNSITDAINPHVIDWIHRHKPNFFNTADQPAAQSNTDGAGIPYSFDHQPQPGAFNGPYKPDFGQMGDMGAPPRSAPLPSDEGLNGGASSGSSLGLRGLLGKPDLIPIGADPTIDEEVSSAQKAADKLGLGSMAKEADRYAADEEAKSAKDNKLDRNLALAQAGFAMAEAASRGGATFLGSAGVGGTALAQGLMKAKEKQDLEGERIEDLKLKALDAADRGKEGIFKTSMEDLQAKIGEKKADIRSNAQTTVEWMKANADMIIARNHDAVMRAVSDKNDPALRGYQLAVAKNPTEENISALNHYIIKAYPSVVASILSGQVKQDIAGNSVQQKMWDMMQNGGGQGGDDMSSWPVRRMGQ